MEIQARKVPEEIRPEIIKHYERLEPTLPRISEQHRNSFVFIFEKYNEYIEPYNKQNINCGACRVKVIGVTRSIVKLWKSGRNLKEE